MYLKTNLLYILEYLSAFIISLSYYGKAKTYNKRLSVYTLCLLKILL